MYFFLYYLLYVLYILSLSEYILKLLILVVYLCSQFFQMQILTHIIKTIIMIGQQAFWYANYVNYDIIHWFWCLTHMYLIGTTALGAHIGGRWWPAWLFLCPWLSKNQAGLGIYPILFVPPDKFARFLFEFHAFRFQASPFRRCPPTAVTLMCTALWKMIRWKQK